MTEAHVHVDTIIAALSKYYDSKHINALPDAVGTVASKHYAYIHQLSGAGPLHQNIQPGQKRDRKPYQPYTADFNSQDQHDMHNKTAQPIVSCENETQNLTYSEITIPSFLSILAYLFTHEDLSVKLLPVTAYSNVDTAGATQCSFLEIGCGTGKCVALAATCGVPAYGIECQRKHYRDAQMLIGSLLLDGEQPADTQLCYGDATWPQHIIVMKRCTHLYSYDLYFPDALLRAIINAICDHDSAVKVYVCFTNLDRLIQANPIAKKCLRQFDDLQATNTGSESKRCYSYQRVASQ